MFKCIVEMMWFNLLQLWICYFGYIDKFIYIENGVQEEVGKMYYIFIGVVLQEVVYYYCWFFQVIGKIV